MIPTVNVPNGTYPATLTNYGIWENTKNGNLSAFIDIEIELGGKAQKLRWFGGISTTIGEGKKRAPRDWTMQTLIKICPDFTWKALITKAKENVDDKELIGMDVSVVILNELNPTTKKIMARVKYINPIQTKFNKLSPKALSSLGDDTGPDFNDDIPF